MNFPATAKLKLCRKNTIDGAVFNCWTIHKSVNCKQTSTSANCRKYRSRGNCAMDKLIEYPKLIKRILTEYIELCNNRFIPKLKPLEILRFSILKEINIAFLRNMRYADVCCNLYSIKLFIAKFVPHLYEKGYIG